MDRRETTEFLEDMNASIQFFSVDPDRACGSWHAILGKYSLDECLGAMEYFMGNADNPPTPHSIKGYCDRRRKETEQAKDAEKGDQWSRQAKESFRNVPGRNRGEKVVYTCAQRAAQKWLGGERDNEFYNDMLLTARTLGITFDGVVYDGMVNTGASDFVRRMAQEAMY